MRCCDSSHFAEFFSSSSGLRSLSIFVQFEPYRLFFRTRLPFSKTLIHSKCPFFRDSASLRLYPSRSGESRWFFSSPCNGRENEIELFRDSSMNSVIDDYASAPSLKFFKDRDLDEKNQSVHKGQIATGREISDDEKADLKEGNRICAEYYDPKAGDLVVGVVVSGNDYRIDVNVGAEMLGSMLTKEVLPFYNAELAYLCCDMEKDAADFMVRGKVGVVKDEDAMGTGNVSQRTVVKIGTILFSVVLGRTLGGRPLLSSRRIFSRLAWLRVRQIQQLKDPIEVKILKWNTGGLVTMVEGIRAFLPKTELMNRVSSFVDLKKYVGQRMLVSISRLYETTNALIISEREAWDILHLKEGTVLEGSIHKIFSFGAQVRIGETNRCGLLHISNISRAHVASVSDVLQVDEKVKVLIVKSLFPYKISLSIADLESKPGLFLSDKEKVFCEAEDMAKRYREAVVAAAAAPTADEVLILPFNDDEAKLYANWNWFEFVE